MNVGCGHEFILIGIRPDESPPEPFGQFVAVELNFDGERVAVRRGLEPQQWAFVAIEPFAHFPLGSSQNRREQRAHGPPA